LWYNYSEGGNLVSTGRETLYSLLGDLPDRQRPVSVLRTIRIGHFETAAMRAEIFEFLEKWL